MSHYVKPLPKGCGLQQLDCLIPLVLCGFTPPSARSESGEQPFSRTFLRVDFHLKQKREEGR